MSFWGDGDGSRPGVFPSFRNRAREKVGICVEQLWLQELLSLEEGFPGPLHGHCCIPQTLAAHYYATPPHLGDGRGQAGL